MNKPILIPLILIFCVFSFVSFGQEMKNEKGFLKPVGEWNQQEVIVQHPKITVILNGTVILEGDYLEASKNGTLDGKEHPGLQRDRGHIGFLGHGDVVHFKNIRIKEL
jgi:hypothetical protein